MRVRILIADQAEARFYDAFGYLKPLRLVSVVRNPAARLHERDLVSDRAGRGIGRTVGGRRHRTGPSYGAGHEHGARRHALHLFARRIAGDLMRARRARRFDRVVLVAGPVLLGELRAALNQELQSCVALTITKDIVHRADWDVRTHLPAEVFTGPVEFERRRA